MTKKWQITFKEIIKDSFPTRTSGNLDSLIVEGGNIQSAIRNYYDVNKMFFKDTIHTNDLYYELFLIDKNKGRNKDIDKILLDKFIKIYNWIYSSNLTKKGEQMIKFEIALPHNNGMKEQDRLDFFDFIDELNGDDLKFLLDGGHIKQMRPIKITMKRSK